MTGFKQFRGVPLPVFQQPASPAGYAGPTDIYSFLKTLKKEGEHGAGFVYHTVQSQVLGWIVSRVTSKHFADVMRERIWNKMGMEEDACVMVDPVGTPQ